MSKRKKAKPGKGVVRRMPDTIVSSNPVIARQLEKGIDLPGALNVYLQTVKAFSANLRASDITDDKLLRILTQTLEHTARAREDEGLVFGPLSVAAEYVAEQLAENVDGIDADDLYSVQHYLVGRWGELIHEMEEHPEIWRAWDDGRRERTLVAAHATAQADDDGDHR